MPKTSDGWFKGNQPDDAVEADDGGLEFDADFHRNKKPSRKKKPRRKKGDDGGLEFDCEFVKNIPDLIDQLEDLQPMLTEHFVGDGVIIDKLIDLLSAPTCTTAQKALRRHLLRVANVQVCSTFSSIPTHPPHTQ